MEPQESRGGVLGMMTGAVAAVVATATLLWEKATQDGHLAAAGRQGIDEIGVALKAFPDSVQAQETGTLFSPTQGEIAAERRTTDYGNWQSSRLPSPSEIVRESAAASRGDEERQDLPSPSQIADGRGARAAEPEPGKEQARELEHTNEGYGR